MEKRVVLVREPIDAARLLEAVGSAAAGANVLCLGTTRGVTDGVVTRSLEYEAHETMAAERLSRRQRRRARQAVRRRRGRAW